MSTSTTSGVRDRAALATPVVDPDPALVGPLDAGSRARRSGSAPRVTAGDLARAERTALAARIDHLEHRLSVARRRQQETIRRYERILEARTEAFRSWVTRGDPRPSEFEWIGRSPAVTPGDGPPASGTGTSVATDGGRDRTTPGADGRRASGILSTVVEGVNALLSRIPGVSLSR